MWDTNVWYNFICKSSIDVALVLNLEFSCSICYLFFIPLGLRKHVRKARGINVWGRRTRGFSGMLKFCKRRNLPKELRIRFSRWFKDTFSQKELLPRNMLPDKADFIAFYIFGFSNLASLYLFKKYWIFDLEFFCFNSKTDNFRLEKQICCYSHNLHAWNILSIKSFYGEGQYIFYKIQVSCKRINSIRPSVECILHRSWNDFCYILKLRILLWDLHLLRSRG